MDRHVFSAAKAVFYPDHEAARDRRENAVVHYGFHCAFDRPDARKAAVHIAARNFYRLYLNGEIVMHGPARTAHGYARVDEIEIGKYLTDGENHIAVEVVAYGDFYKGYSNRCTLEAGMLTAEVRADGEILCATGRGGWQVCRLTERAGRAERISHSRECAEVYHISPDGAEWRFGRSADFVAAEAVIEPVYLRRYAPLPTLKKIPAREMTDFGACRIDPQIDVAPEFWNRSNYTPEGYYESLPEHPLKDCRQTVEDGGFVSAKRGETGILISGETDKYITFDMGENCVGFVEVELTAQNAGVIDIVHSEWLDPDGNLPYAHNTVARIHVSAGRSAFVSMEPAVARCIRLYCRGTGDTTVHGIFMREYTIPDENCSSFQCSDEDVNRLYSAAKRTLVLNTLDIFMDCPDRERGGWLCDSLWTARAAAMMLSDACVERDFIENFLLTPADGMSNAFFPEVYPANKTDYKNDTGLSTWSFWLMCELCEYVRRTGDRAFALEYASRVEAFVRGSGSFIGGSGLIEDLEGIFIDWSLANRPEYQCSISTPVNALYAFMMTELGELYGRVDWTARGEAMRGVLRDAIVKNAGGLNRLKTFPDGWTFENGGMRPGSCTSESGMATALWSGLFTAQEAPALFRTVRDCMGPAPEFPSDPNIGKSGLFIGLCIRMDMLCRLGAFGRMFDDMKAIYMPQLKEGPGTLWEHSVIDSSSRCHGFNGHAGVHLMRDVLGMGMPERGEDGAATMAIAPHICGLRWAKGFMELPEGLVSVRWQYDGGSFVLDVYLPEPGRFRADVRLPAEVRALDAENVRVRIH